eukprot:c25264_g1_i2 orf=301-1410(-)
MGLEDPIVPLIDNLNIDMAFVVPPEHRPQRPHNAYVHSNDSIPVIDLSSLWCSPCDTDSMRRLIDEVGKACERWGFFQVINHGVPIGLLEKVRKEARAFFALPLEEKWKVKRTFDNPLGYYDTELTKNVRDWKEVFDISVAGQLDLPVEIEGDRNEISVSVNQWPVNPPGLREACETYIAAAEKLAFSLLELISQSLGLPSNWFHHLFKPGTSFLRLNHYPVCPAPELALGVSRHKDSGALTVLAQDDVGGLEVRRKDGEWIGVKPDMSSFVINVGDLVQVWSNDRYQSVEHRVVVNENRDRYSIPLFFNPNYSVEVFPLPESTDDECPPRYRSFTWGKFLRSRRNSNFKNLGVENLQISHYAIHPSKQ